MLGEFIKKLVKSSPIPLVSDNNEPTVVLWVLCFLCVVVIPLGITAFFLRSSSLFGGGNDRNGADEKKRPIRPDFSGVWKRTALCDDNLAGFVAATGATVLQRRFAVTMPSFHTLDMDRAGTKLRLQEKCGPVDTDVTYTIQDGQTARSEFRIRESDKEYEDALYWGGEEDSSSSGSGSGDVLVLRRLHVPEKDFQITVRRSLDSVSLTKGADGQEPPRTMRVESTVRRLKKGAAAVVGMGDSSVSSPAVITTVATYTFMGPPPSASAGPAADDGSCGSGAAASPDAVDDKEAADS